MHAMWLHKFKKTSVYKRVFCLSFSSYLRTLRSRPLEVVGAKKNEHARGRHGGYHDLRTPFWPFCPNAQSLRPRYFPAIGRGVPWAHQDAHGWRLSLISKSRRTKFDLYLDISLDGRSTSIGCSLQQLSNWSKYFSVTRRSPNLYAAVRKWG